MQLTQYYAVSLRNTNIATTGIFKQIYHKIKFTEF